MHNYQVRPFSQYVVRTPTFPVSTYLNVVNDYSSQALLTGFKILFLEAIHRITRTINRIRQMERKPASLSIKKRCFSAYTIEV
jgi:hypothetical protein